jgi:hypothetical protein
VPVNAVSLQIDRDLRKEPFEPDRVMAAVREMVRTWDCGPRRRQHVISDTAAILTNTPAQEGISLQQWWLIAEERCTVSEGRALVLGRFVQPT